MNIREAINYCTELGYCLEEFKLSNSADKETIEEMLMDIDFCLHRVVKAIYTKEEI